MMDILSQLDERWSQKKIGASSLTIGRYGCTITCIAMLSTYFGCPMMPDEIAAHGDWFTPQGLILWNKLVFPKFKFVYRYYTRDDMKIEEMIKGPLTACILEVDNHSHWVVPQTAIPMNDYRIADPWGGREAKAVATYKNITGFSTFEAT